MKRILLTLAMVCGMAAPLWAAVTPNAVITAQTPSRGILSFGATASCTGSGTPYTCCTGSGTGCTIGTYSTAYTAGTNGSRCNAFWVDNNDPSATHIITCQLVNTSNKYGSYSLTTVSPAGATSFNQATLMPSSSVVGSDSDGNPFIELNSGDTLQCTFATAITSGDQIDVHTHCADF